MLEWETSKENPGAAGNGTGDSVVGLLPFEFELKVSWHDAGRKYAAASDEMEKLCLMTIYNQ